MKIIKCLKCGKETSNKKFCSISCSAFYRKGVKFTKQHRENLSKSMKGKTSSEETKKILSEIHKQRYIDNPELKLQISKKMKEKFLDQNYYEKWYESIPKGKEHPNYGKRGENATFYGIKHSEKTKEEMSKKQKGKNHPMYGKHHKEKSKKKTSKSVKQWWNSKDGIKYREIQRNKMKNGMSSYANSFITNPSKPQLELYKIIVSIFPDAILNYAFLNYSLDIAIPKKKIVIEYDGSYWHRDKDYDIKRKKEIENHGWKFIKFVDYLPSKNEIIKILKNLKIEGA